MGSPVIVSDYEPAWPHQFERLRQVLARVLGDVAMRIEHVGSTAVPGLAAKAVLDIDVVIASREKLPDVLSRLATLGYEHEGDRGVEGREAFRAQEGTPAQTWPKHHLYVCAHDNRELLRHVTFRDWLRSHEQERVQYAALKRALAHRYGDDRDGYCEAKTAFVEDVLARAATLGDR